MAQPAPGPLRPCLGVKELAALTDAELLDVLTAYEARLEHEVNWRRGDSTTPRVAFEAALGERVRRLCLDTAEPAGAPPAPLAGGPCFLTTDHLGPDLLRELYVNHLDEGMHVFLRGTCRALRDACPKAPWSRFKQLKRVSPGHLEPRERLHTYTFWRHAAASVSLLRWSGALVEEDPDAPREPHLLSVDDGMRGAAAGGHVRVLQYFLQGGYVTEAEPCALTDMAVRYGQLEALHLLYVGDTWDDVRRNVCKLAAVHGQLRILRWMRARGNPWGFDVHGAAVQHGQVELVRWLEGHACPRHAHVIAIAAAHGQLAMMRALQARAHAANTDEGDEDDEWDLSNGMNACTEAATHGHVDCLAFAREMGFSLERVACYGAALNGHIDCLKFLRDEGCEWDVESVVGAAVERGHLTLLEWVWGPGGAGAELATEQQCELALDAFSDAVSPEALNALKALRALGCAWDRRIVVAAAERGDVRALKYVRAQGGLRFDDRACLAAIQNCKGKALRYLCRQGARLTPRVLNAALRSDDVYAMVKIVLEHDCPANAGSFKWARACGDGGAQDMFHGHFGSMYDGYGLSDGDEPSSGDEEDMQ